MAVSILTQPTKYVAWNVAGIYSIRNTISGRIYVGSSVQVRERWKHHKLALRKGTHHSRPLQRSWIKHGEAAFVFELLEVIEDHNNLIVREQHWMESLLANHPRQGFNVCPAAGSPRGHKHSPETRAKMSAAKKKIRGPLSASHKAIISAAKLGVKMSLASRENMSKSRLGKKMPPRTDVYRKTMSMAKKGTIRSLESREKQKAAWRAKASQLSLF